MPALSIQEPDTRSMLPKAYGIDLGTTHSILAQEHDGAIHYFADKQNQTLLPSCVHYGDSDDVVVGCDALVKFKQNCPFTYRSVKRLIGSEQANTQLKTPCGHVSPVEASTHILQALIARLPQPNVGIQAVITVPAYFNEVQRQLTKQAAKHAGIDVLRLLNEPTAAAVAYGLDNARHGKVLVFDFGGGTFDVSILKIESGVIEVLATKGDTQLGGDDIDELIVQWCHEQVPMACLLPHNQLLSVAKQAKEQLTSEPSATINLGDNTLTLNTTTFNELIEPIITKLIGLCVRALHDANLDSADLAAVVCVGGASKIPYIRQSLSEHFVCELKDSIDPERVVAHGAAVLASILSGHRPNDDCLLLDVAPLSLGIETMGGMVEKLIPRNCKIPVQKTTSFTTQQDGQSAFSLRIVQGEREFAADNQELAHFYLKGLPRLARGQVKIDVTFSLDCDGLLEISATTTDKQHQITKSIKPTFGMNEHHIQRTLEDAVEHASEDVGKRLLQEKRMKAREFIFQCRRFVNNRRSMKMGELNEMLSEFERELDTLADGRDITSKIAQIEQLTEQLIEESVD